LLFNGEISINLASVRTYANRWVLKSECDTLFYSETALGPDSRREPSIQRQQDLRDRLRGRRSQAEANDHVVQREHDTAKCTADGTILNRLSASDLVGTLADCTGYVCGFFSRFRNYSPVSSSLASEDRKNGINTRGTVSSGTRCLIVSRATLRNESEIR